MASSASSTAVPSFSWPIAGPVAQEFGHGGHPGIDIDGPNAGQVHAAAGGTVTSAGFNAGGYGNMVDIDHGGGYLTKYAHLSAINVSVGQQVGAGQVIGLEGSTGHSTGPHVHFEIRVNGSVTNPRQFIGGDPSTSSPANPVSSAVGAAAGVSLPNPVSGLGQAADLLRLLSDSATWLRVFWVMLGFGAIGLGIAMVTRRTWGPVAKDVALDAAKAAVVA